MMHSMQSFEIVKEHQQRIQRQVEQQRQVNGVKQETPTVSRFVMRFRQVGMTEGQGQPQAARSRITAELRAVEAGS